MGNIAPSDHALAQAIEAPAPGPYDAALFALYQLVGEFTPPELDAAQADDWLYQVTQYLLDSDRDVYLGYLAPTTIQ